MNIIFLILAIMILWTLFPIYRKQRMLLFIAAFSILILAQCFLRGIHP